MDTKQEVQKKCYVNKWGDIDPQGLSILSLADLKTFTNNGRIFIMNKKPLQHCLECIYTKNKAPSLGNQRHPSKF